MRGVTVMRQDMSNKLIMAPPDHIHAQLAPSLPGEMVNKPALPGNWHQFGHQAEILSDIT